MEYAILFDLKMDVLWMMSKQSNVGEQAKMLTMLL